MLEPTGGAAGGGAVVTTGTFTGGAGPEARAGFNGATSAGRGA